MRKKHFYFMLLVLALILLALPGFAAKAAKRVAGPALRFASSKQCPVRLRAGHSSSNQYTRRRAETPRLPPPHLAVIR